jgi:hypothetical protein
MIAVFVIFALDTGVEKWEPVGTMIVLFNT